MPRGGTMLTHMIWSESETFSCLSPSSVINLVYTFTYWFLSLKWGTHLILNDATKYRYTLAHFHFILFSSNSYYRYHTNEISETSPVMYLVSLKHSVFLSLPNCHTLVSTWCIYHVHLEYNAQVSPCKIWHAKVFARLNETSITCSVICRRHFRELAAKFFVELTGRGYFDLFGKVGRLCTVFETAERFHPRGQEPYKFTGTEEGSYITKRFSSHRSEDWFEKPTWPLFHCFGTPILPSWRHENALLLVRTWRHGCHACWWSRAKVFRPSGN